MMQAISKAAQVYYDWSKPVLGLSDVVRGVRVLVPTTIYRLHEDDCSGVMGLLQPSGEFLSKAPSSVGTIVKGLDPQGIPFEATIVWDGATPSPKHELPIGRLNEEGSKPLYQEHSKGLLLGDYTNTGALWSAVAAGRGM